MNYTPITAIFNIQNTNADFAISDNELHSDFAFSDNELNVKFRFSYPKKNKNKLFFGEGHLGQRISNRRM